jgi:hypothetical protein
VAQEDPGRTQVLQEAQFAYGGGWRRACRERDRLQRSGGRVSEGPWVVVSQCQSETGEDRYSWSSVQPVTRETES